MMHRMRSIMLLIIKSLVQRSGAFLLQKQHGRAVGITHNRNPSTFITKLKHDYMYCTERHHYEARSFRQNSSLTSSSSSSSSSSLHSTFLRQVEDTVENVQSSLPSSFGMEDIHTLEPKLREAVGVANRLSNRISNLRKNDDCPTCWLQRKHCICDETPPIDDIIPSNIHRLFMIMHHKEIGLVVDTAKVLLNSMPSRARLVVSGIGEEYQDSMVELMDAMQQKDRRCIVLFPTDDARTFEELIGMGDTDAETGSDDHVENDNENKNINDDANGNDNGELEMFDVIVMDGTWSQARKIHSRYIPLEKDGGPPRVCLSQESLDILGSTTTAEDDERNVHILHGIQRGGSGRQLRRHPIKWKEVSTLEATRLLLRDMLSLSGEHENKLTSGGKACHDVLSKYQQISDTAAVRQLGPPRRKDLTRS